MVSHGCLIQIIITEQLNGPFFSFCLYLYENGKNTVQEPERSEYCFSSFLKTICFSNLTLFLQKQLLATAHFSMLETTKLEVNQPHHERKEGNVNAAFE